ncbi:MAG: phenylalanine--tRNA ligase subunit beta [Pseudomonadota bacterium]
MKFSECWLREWVNPALGTDELIKLLTMAGLEVDSIDQAAAQFSGVVVGEVLSTTKHPDAEKLSVCEVSDGKEVLQVVCGASNVRAGLKVPFAKIGAILSTELKIKKAKLRGIESNGMLCSATELGLAEESDGLFELPSTAPTGANIRKYLQLDDVVIDVDLTPNRGDCLSIAGLAREVGVLTRTDITPPQISSVAASISDTFNVELSDPLDCPRYLGRIIRNINPDAQTPLWMEEKLRRSGLRPIDPVVDVTNFVLLELGQPMHAFDFGKLEGGIRVRRASQDEKLVLLDGKEVKLTPNTLVIADHQKAIAMAGIMGGKQTAVGPKTTQIFLESAFFAPLAIAGRARSYGMHTDAAHRYERGVDYNLAPIAMERATALLLEIVGGQAGPVIEAKATLPVIPPVTLRAQRIEALLGMSLPADEVNDILLRLGLQQVSADMDKATWSIPSWRFDLSIEADLIEECARVYGYDKLPVTYSQTSLSLQHQPERITPLKSIRSACVGLGYQEVVTYSFVEPELAEILALNKEDAITLANPISQDMSVMRSNLWPGLILTLKHNQNRQQTRMRLFESGLVFSKKDNEITQTIKVGCLIWGAHQQEQWATKERDVDFFDIKGDAETILSLTHALEEFSFQPGKHPALQPGQSAQIYRQGMAVGWIGALHPKIIQALDVPGKVYLLELDYELIKPGNVAVVTELSRFPLVRRDLALTVDKAVSAGSIHDLLKKTAGSDLKELIIFDLYEGQNIAAGKKSLALGLTFQHPSRTLADAEINPIIDNCINALAATFNAELRK